METDAKEFLKEMKNERDLFVRKINEQDWNTELRTSAEDILIAYDQMRRRIELWGCNFDLDNLSK